MTFKENNYFSNRPLIYKCANLVFESTAIQATILLTFVESEFPPKAGNVLKKGGNQQLTNTFAQYRPLKNHTL